MGKTSVEYAIGLNYNTYLKLLILVFWKRNFSHWT